MPIVVDYKVENNNYINDCVIFEYWDKILVKKYRTSMRYYGGNVKDFIEISNAKLFWFNYELELF